MLTTAPANLSVAKPTAPEDLRAGERVAVLNEVVEYASFLWCSDASLLPPDEPVRLTFRPLHAGLPLKVESVCLPFVLVKRPCGRHQTLDVRMCQLARLDRRYARAVEKACRGKRKKKSSKAAQKSKKC